MSASATERRRPARQGAARLAPDLHLAWLRADAAVIRPIYNLSMPPAVPSRVVISFVILLVCVIASLRGRHVTPVRTVTEVVSVTFVPARSAARTDALQPIAPREATAVAVDGAQERSTPVMADGQPRANSKAVRPALVPGASQRPPMKAAPRRPHPVVAARAPDATKHQGPVAVACRTPACRGAAVNHPATGPKVPAIFVPLRDFGILLESKLVDAKAACDVPFRTSRAGQGQALDQQSLGETGRGQGSGVWTSPNGGGAA